MKKDRSVPSTESIEDAVEARDLDQKGIAIAARRSREIDIGIVAPLSHEEFRRLTCGNDSGSK